MINWVKGGGVFVVEPEIFAKCFYSQVKKSLANSKRQFAYNA